MPVSSRPATCWSVPVRKGTASRSSCRGRSKFCNTIKLARRVQIVTHEAGSFMGELAQLSGRPVAGQWRGADRRRSNRDRARSPACRAGRRGRAWRADHARPDPAPRRPDRGRAGPVVVGRRATMPTCSGWSISSAATAIPISGSIPRHDSCAPALVERFQVDDEELPIVLCPSGQLLRNPTEGQLARCLGLVGPIDPDQLFDVVVVGAGPAGLATAVYAGFRRAVGPGARLPLLRRQAGASARIENYLGFPTGISGMALMGRAYSQAQKFGVEMAIPDEVDAARMRQRSLLAGACQWRAGAGAFRRHRDRRALSPARCRAARRVRRHLGPLLGLAARGRPLRRPGGRAGRRRQFGRAGGGVPRQPRRQGDHGRAPTAQPDHVAISGRADRKPAQRRCCRRSGSRGARRRGRPAGGGHPARSRIRRRGRLAGAGTSSPSSARSPTPTGWREPASSSTIAASS